MRDGQRRFTARTSLGLADSLGGAINAQDEARATQTARNLTSQRTWTTADFDDAKTRTQRQGIGDLLEAVGKPLGQDYSTAARKFWLSQPELPSGAVT